MEIYQVGGAVRDTLLGLPVKDRDWVVVGATADALLSQGYKQVGADFPVFLHPVTHEEYALARTERKAGRGYKGFVAEASADVTLEQDLARRDFTINAMAMTATGTIVDPYGGRRDLEQRLLRHVTGAFVEDPLRVLRAARFAARLNFGIAPETRALMAEIVRSGELETIAPERVWAELRNALSAEEPSRFIEALRDCGACAALFPEIDRLFGVPQPARYHPEIDTGVHILLALSQAVRRGAAEIVRFAVLMHDLGKGTTPPEKWPAHHGHEDRGVDLIESFCTRWRVPREHRELAVLVSRLHTRVHRSLEMRPATVIRLLEEADAFRRESRFEAVLEACFIDATGRAGLEDADYPQAAALRRARAIAAAVPIEPLLARGLRGRELSAALHQARVNAFRDSDSE